MTEEIAKIKTKLIVRWMRRVINLALFILAIVLLCFLIRETCWLLVFLFKERVHGYSYSIIEIIITWFLYFEFIALIIKYFDSHFHFPLRYFIYIAITAITRLIIVDHEKPMDTLLYALAILVLLGALYIANTKLLKRT